MTEPSAHTGVSEDVQRYTAATTPPTGELPQSGTPIWSLGQRIGFRFIFAYFALYIVSLLPVPPVGGLWHAVTPWIGAHVLHLAAPIRIIPTGSGDTMSDYVQLLCVVVIALVATVVWSILDRRRTNYTRLHHYLRIGIRYALAFWMLQYGGAKLIKTQFPFPALDRLLEPYGQSSPMGLLWTMMGYSLPYNVFAGMAEAAGGVLLFWRRTTTLGALFVMAAMSNVVMLNFAYDVPVKLFSSNLFLMALVLAAPQCRRLYDALVLNRAVDMEPIAPHSTNPAAHGVRLTLKTLFIFVAVAGPLWGSWMRRHLSGDLRPRPPLYGIWEVEHFTRNGQPVPPLLTDSSRWRYLVLDRPDLASVHFTSETRRFLREHIDTTARRLELTPYPDTTQKLAFTYAQADTSHLALTGTMRGDSVDIRLRRLGMQDFLLVRRGYHWINEVPFNR